MSKTRFAPWVVFACIGTLAGCTSGEDGTVGNTELNVVLPNGCDQDSSAPECFDIQVVEYTIACDDGDPAPNGPFLDNGAGFDDRVVISGVLEVFDTPQPGRDGRATSGDPWTWGKDLGAIYVAQGFMDLPVTQRCSAQLRARTAPTSDNPQGEVVCTDTVTFEVEADQISTVNVLMVCGLSFQAPVAQLDLAGDFTFNVANFCPDQFVLNCIDTDLDIRATPAGEFAVTACQVRFRDGDSQCGNSCDPQTCTTAPEGLRCVPGPDPAPTPGTATPGEGVSTTVTCRGGELGPFPGSIINCDGSGQPAANCVFDGDTLGVIGAPPPGPPPALGGPGPGEGGFFVACVLCDDAYVTATGGQDPRCPTATGQALAPGATVTCTAVTTDGDTDCDKTKVVQLTCPGLTACQAFEAGGGTCDDGSVCTDNVCTDAGCDGTVAGCCTNPATNEGGDCSAENPPLASCQSGVCMSDACGSDADCENPATECMVAPPGACQADGSCLGEVAGNFGAACDSGTGSGDGTCGASGTAEAGTCESNDACTTATEVADCLVNTNGCLLNQCDEGVTPYVCETVDNDNASCDANGLPGICQGGSCIPNPPYVSTGAGDTTHRAGPRFCISGEFPFIDAPRSDCALCLENSCSGGDNALRACTTLTTEPGGPGDECPGGTCIEATPGPTDCSLDCFTFVCLDQTDILFPGGGAGGACVYPGITTNCPFKGCQVVSNTLKNQLSIDTFLDLDVTSTGLPDREVTVEYNVRAVNAGLALAGPLANLGDVTILTNITGATTSVMTTKLDPTLQGTSVDAYTGTGDFVLTAGFAVDGDQLNPTTEALLPTASPVVLAFDETDFNIALVIKSSGAPLDITGNNCTFSNEAGTCLGGANDLDECDPAAPDGSTGLADCTEADIFPPNNTPGTCEVTDGSPVSLPATFP